MNTTKRPISVSIISWLLIITSGWAVIYTPFSLNNPVTQQMLQATGATPLVALLLGELGGIANITAGMAMLKRCRWGRQLYLIITPVALLLSVALYGVKLLAILSLGFITYAVFFVLLTRRSATDYFSDSVTTMTPPSDVQIGPNVQETTSGKRVASIFLLISGGLMLNVLFMMIFPLSGNLFALLILSGIFGVIAGACLIPAIFLWGRKRWAGVLGTVFTSVGECN